MKKFVCVIMSAVLICLCFAGCSGTKSDKEKVLKVGYIENCEPFITVSENGEGSGFDVELLELLNEEYGLHVEFDKLEFVKMNLGDKLSSDENSDLPRLLIGGIRKNTGNINREYTWSDVILSNRIITVVPAGSAIKGYSDLADKKVMYVGSDAKAALDKNASLAACVSASEAKDASAALSALSAKKCDAVIIEELAYEKLDDAAKSSVSVLNGELDTIEYAFAFAKWDTDFRDSFNTNFKTACNDKDNGDLIKPLAEKAFGVDTINPDTAETK